MAVKPELIKARLKVKYPKANLSKERLDELSARLCKIPEDDADETAVDAVLDQADAMMPFEEIAKTDDTIRTLKSKTQEQKTPEELAAEAKAKTDAEAAKKAKDEALKEAPDWFKSFSEDVSKKLETFSSDITTLKTGKVTETKMQQLNALFEANEVLKGLPEGIKSRALKTIDLESDLETQVESASKDFEGFAQANVNSSEFAGSPGKGVSNTKPSDKEVDAVIDAM